MIGLGVTSMQAKCPSSARTISTNTQWRSDAFRGYADYAETADFAAGLAGALMSSVFNYAVTKLVTWRDA